MVCCLEDRYCDIEPVPQSQNTDGQDQMLLIDGGETTLHGVQVYLEYFAGMFLAEATLPPGKCKHGMQ